MPRIIAGRWGGRRISAPPGASTRPTTDRVRESIFAILTAQFGTLDGLAVLDLYAGSGALGLEALSRGAARADLVEADPGAARTLAANIAALGAGAQVHRTRVETFLDDAGPARYDLILADPPYSTPAAAIDRLLPLIALRLTAHGIVVIERAARDQLHWPEPLAALTDRRYGDTRVWFGELAAA